MAITIADTGCGIAPEDLQRVFEPFFTTKVNGNGLGLSICRSILWEIGGTMSLHSEPRKGTRVQVTVPWASSKLAGAMSRAVPTTLPPTMQ
jgi:signal transduction histidine kinase